MILTHFNGVFEHLFGLLKIGLGPFEVCLGTLGLGLLESLDVFFRLLTQLNSMFLFTLELLEKALLLFPELVVFLHK